VLLLLLLILYPYVGSGEAGQLFIVAIYIAIPLSAIYATSYSRPGMLASLVLGLPLILAGVDFALGTNLVPQIARDVVSIVFFAFASLVALVHIIRQKRIEADTLYGAVCVYLMLGLTWFVLYSFIHHLDPGAFYCGADQNLNGIIDSADLLYFSFVTLTTLGYGDITPVSANVRSLSFLEAATGTLYSAILIARLVGLYTAQFNADKEVSQMARLADQDRLGANSTRDQST
jgi:hypothetical protein